MSFGGDLADAILKAAEANKTAIEAIIASGEADIEGLVLGAIKNMPAPHGALAIVFPAIESELASFVKGAVAKYGADAIFIALDAEAHALAKQLGG